MYMRLAKSVAPLALLALCGCSEVLGVHEGGFNLISLDQEWQMRDDLMRQVEKEMTVVHDHQAVAYLNQIGREIVAQTDLAGRPWDFGIVRDDTINAFNLPGGLVYVNSGLIARAEDLDELAGVLAHEIGHGVARHGTQMMTREYGFNIISGIVLGRDPGTAQSVLRDLVGTSVIMDYSRDAEREADRLGVGFEWKAGFDPQGMAQFFQVLLDTRARKPSDVERFFSSHPITEERIASVQDLISQLPPRTGLVKTTRDYERFRQGFR